METSNTPQVRVVNLRKLFFYVLKKTPVLLILLAIGILSGALYSGYQMFTSGDSESRVLTEDDVDMTKIQEYVYYKNLYEAQCAYLEQSCYINLDPSSAVEGTVTFFVESYGLDASTVKSLYESVLMSDENIASILEDSGLSLTVGQFEELFTLSSTASSVKDNMNSDGTLSGEFYEGATLTVSFLYDEEEPVAKVLSKVQEIVLSAAPAGEKMTATVAGSMVTEQFGKKLEIAQHQADAVDKRSGYLTSMEQAKSALSAADLNYYKAELATEEEEEEEGFSIKWPVIVGILFLFAGACYYVFDYILTARLNDEEEVKYLYGLNVLAALPSAKEKKGILKLFTRWEERFLMTASDASYAVKAIKLAAPEGTALLTDRKDQETMKAAENLAALWENLHVEDLLSSSAEAREAVMKQGSAVLLIPMDRMYRSTLSRELDILNAGNVKVLGAILLR